MQVVEARGEDIPFLVNKLLSTESKVLGITGEDLYREFLLNVKNPKTKIIKIIPWKDDAVLFGKPTLCLLGPIGKSLEDMPKRLRVCINRKYAKTSKKFLSRLEDKGFTFEKLYLSGSTEEAFVNNLADIVIDIVYSGESADKAGLKVYEEIFSSDIVIIGGANAKI
jgi:ATP phosphoribosyltransferase